MKKAYYLLLLLVFALCGCGPKLLFVTEYIPKDYGYSVKRYTYADSHSRFELLWMEKSYKLWNVKSNSIRIQYIFQLQSSRVYFTLFKCGVIMI